MADSTTKGTPEPVHHEPVESIHFVEEYADSTNHYFIWAAIILAVVGFVGYAMRDKLFPKPAAEVALLPPTVLALDIQVKADGVSVANKMTMPMAESKATVTTASGGKFEFWLKRVEPGAIVDIPYGTFHDRNGWQLNPSGDKPAVLTVEAFGMKKETPLDLAPASATPPPANSNK